VGATYAALTISRSATLESPVSALKRASHHGFSPWETADVS
jgi:hypothetical protein